MVRSINGGLIWKVYLIRGENNRMNNQSLTLTRKNRYIVTVTRERETEFDDCIVIRFYAPHTLGWGFRLRLSIGLAERVLDGLEALRLTGSR
jgi:hypothetical protein